MKLIILACLIAAAVAMPEAGSYNPYIYGYGASPYAYSYSAYRPAYSYGSYYGNFYNRPYSYGYRHKREAEAEPEADAGIYYNTAALPYATTYGTPYGAAYHTPAVYTNAYSAFPSVYNYNTAYTSFPYNTAHTYVKREAEAEADPAVLYGNYFGNYYRPGYAAYSYGARPYTAYSSYVRPSYYYNNRGFYHY